jgi:hypothetical protein
MVQFMQAILTKHAFESNSLDGVTSLPGHDKLPALPSHSVQVLLTAQTLITALKISDKHRRAIPRFARWTAAEKALAKCKGPDAEVCPINADCGLATHQEDCWNAQSKPINAMDMAWKSFSHSLLRAMKTEGTPYSQGDGEGADSIFTVVSLGLLTDSFPNPVVAEHGVCKGIMHLLRAYHIVVMTFRKWGLSVRPFR